MRIAVNDTELYFDVEGAHLAPDGPTMRERPVVIALHGGPGFDHAYFKPFLSRLANIAQVIYVDLRGQGRSSRPPVETCTLEQMADDIAAFCRILGLDSPAILGHSAGGFVALHLAVRHPDLVGSLILVNTSAATADMGDAMGRLEHLCGAEARAAGERVFGGDFSAEAMAEFGRLVLPAYVYETATARPIFEAMGRTSFSAEVASYYFRERAPHYDLREQLKHINVRALVIAGEDDWLCPVAASQVIAVNLPQAELLVISNARHFSFAEQSSCFVEAVHRFLVEKGTGITAVDGAIQHH